MGVAYISSQLFNKDSIQKDIGTKVVELNERYNTLDQREVLNQLVKENPSSPREVQVWNSMRCKTNKASRISLHKNRNPNVSSADDYVCLMALSLRFY